MIIQMTQEENGSLLASTIFLSSEHIKDDGIYLLENGEDGLIYIGNMANQDTLQQLFGVSSVEGLPSQVPSFLLDFYLSLASTSFSFLAIFFQSRIFVMITDATNTYANLSII